MNIKHSKVFANAIDNINRKEYFNTRDGGKLMAKVPLSWKKPFGHGIIIRHKMKKYGACKKVFCLIIVIN